jgi:hypothetical protein
MTRLSDTQSKEQPAHVLFDAGAVILTRRMLEVFRLITEDVRYFVGASRLKARTPRVDTSGSRISTCASQR